MLVCRNAFCAAKATVRYDGGDQHMSLKTISFEQKAYPCLLVTFTIISVS